MSDNTGPQLENKVTLAEKEKDSMFMYWKAHNQRTVEAYRKGDFDLAEKLAEEATTQPWGVPRLFQGESHAMLASMYDREDFIAQAKAAKEQYRRVFQAHPDDRISEKLYSNAHDLVRWAEQTAGIKELSPLYEKKKRTEDTLTKEIPENALTSGSVEASSSSQAAIAEKLQSTSRPSQAGIEEKLKTTSQSSQAGIEEELKTTSQKSQVVLTKPNAEQQGAPEGRITPEPRSSLHTLLTIPTSPEGSETVVGSERGSVPSSPDAIIKPNLLSKSPEKPHRQRPEPLIFVDKLPESPTKSRDEQHQQTSGIPKVGQFSSSKRPAKTPKVASIGSVGRKTTRDGADTYAQSPVFPIFAKSFEELTAHIPKPESTYLKPPSDGIPFRGVADGEKGIPKHSKSGEDDKSDIEQSVKETKGSGSAGTSRLKKSKSFRDIAAGK